jgi:hypothetical protein
MLPPVKTSQANEICGRLQELIQDPKSFGLREGVPRRVLDLLASTRNMLTEYLYDGRMPPAVDNDLAAELSQDADARNGFRGEEKSRPFNVLLCRRMEQLSLSPHDVAVTLGSTLQYVSDLRSGVKMPSEQRIVEFALLLGATQESLRTAVKEQTNAMAAVA